MKGLVTFLSVACVISAETSNGTASPKPADEKAVSTVLSSMPLAFTRNDGQWDRRVLFRAEAGGATIFFCRDGVSYFFTRDTDELLDCGILEAQEVPGIQNGFNRPLYRKEGLLIETQFVDANPVLQVVGENRLVYNCNYFHGDDPARWRTDVPNYSAIVYKDIWPGIDLRYQGDGRGMKYDFIVNPGADVSLIRIRYDGVDGLAITSDGDLQVDTRFGLICDNISSVYQDYAGIRHYVAGRYRIVEPGILGFEIGSYDASATLVIDPALTFSTFLGGSNYDIGWDIAVDDSGDPYVAGGTSSGDFPTVDPYQQDLSGPGDIFVTKFDASGGEPVYSTYLGGTAGDLAWAIAVDGNGSAYIAGETGSSDFPRVNPYDNSYNGDGDVFVTKLSAAGNSLVYSTYLGGSGAESGDGIAVDLSGNAYVTGTTESSDFPTVNPFDGSFNGFYDVFVAKLSSSGSNLLYSTYLGGAYYDIGLDIAVDLSGSAYVTGRTPAAGFPTANPYDGSYNGGLDAFVTKLTVAGDNLVYSTYLGGGGNDIGTSIAVDESGNAYVTGSTSSSNFPTVNPYDGSSNGFEDVFVTKLAAAGDVLIYSTYLGGANGSDQGEAIGIDDDGYAYVAGWTYSDDFPVLDAYDETLDGPQDVFVTSLDPSGNALSYSTYLGGDNIEYGWGIAVFDAENVYVTGQTESSDFPTANPYDDSYNGAIDAFVSKFGLPGQTDCSYIPGDVNYNGTPLELGDVVSMIEVYRGNSEAAYTCFCPPHAEAFEATADTNGNCLALELTDLIVEINAYRGISEVSSCPDCPGS